MKIILIIIIILLLIILLFGVYSRFGDNSNIVPKIIHQTAPSDKSKWSKEWAECQTTWFKYFSDFEYKMWNDDDLDALVKEKFPEFWDYYKNYDTKIKKIDAARYCILYEYGGMYVDMDFLCYKNFWNMIPQDKISLVESPFTTIEYLQNSLMISPIKQKFWLDVLEEAKKRTGKFVVDATGPRLLSDCYFKNKTGINILRKEIYNPDKNVEYNTKMVTRQLMTHSWKNY
jgi:mannosyltransferase OCH1-like enzyme